MDRGYRAQNNIGKTTVIMPKNLKRENYYLKKKREERCRSRAGIEALISHLKHDHRMLRNYLKGTNDDKINTLLAASAYNMRKWMRMKKEEFFVFVLCRYLLTPIHVPVNIERSETWKNVNYYGSTRSLLNILIAFFSFNMPMVWDRGSITSNHNAIF